MNSVRQGKSRPRPSDGTRYAKFIQHRLLNTLHVIRDLRHVRHIKQLAPNIEIPRLLSFRQLLMIET